MSASETKKERGLYGKYRVDRTDGTDSPGGKHEGCEHFVLDITHDPHAAPALRAYADSCEADGYGPLALDLRIKARQIDGKPLQPNAQPESIATTDEVLAAHLDEIAEGMGTHEDEDIVRDAAKRLRELAAEKQRGARLVRAALEFAASVDGTADQFTAAEDRLNNAAIDFAVDSVEKHIVAAIDDARQQPAQGGGG